MKPIRSRFDPLHQEFKSAIHERLRADSVPPMAIGIHPAKPKGQSVRASIGIYPHLSFGRGIRFDTGRWGQDPANHETQILTQYFGDADDQLG